MTNRTKAIIGLGSVFILGGICGALIFGVIIRDRIHEAQNLRNRQGFVEYFEKRLELSEAQRDSLHDELEHAYEKLADLRFSAIREYNEVIDSLRIKIYPQLTPEQRELFNMQEQKFRRFMPREAPRPHAGMIPPPGARREPPPEALSSAAPPEEEPAPTQLKPQAEAQKPSASAVAPDTTDAMRESQWIENANARLEKMKQQLHLTDDQTKQVRQLFADAATQIKQARIDYATQPMLRMMTVRQIARDARRRVGSILTDEQRAILQQNREERKNGSHGPGEK
jgi:hypothetical protein